MESLSCILPDALYLGNLESALAPALLARHGITHVVSILQDWSSAGAHHLVVDLDDSETENLLVHLPRVCNFIDCALAARGVVLVHCFGGVSRSASCVIAYLMRKNNWKLVPAIQFVRERRSVITPNDGFLYQLQVFERCRYAVAEDHPTYISWKRAYDNAIAKSELSLVHIIPVVEGRIYFSSDFPSSEEDVNLVLGEHSITHVVRVVLTGRQPQDIQGFSLYQVEVPNLDQQEQLLISLTGCVDFIHSAIESGGRVLVHSLAASTASTVICAYLMSTRKSSVTDAAGVLGESIPFFSLKQDAVKRLELYEACDYRPVREHPLVQQWIDSRRCTTHFQRGTRRVVLVG